MLLCGLSLRFLPHLNELPRAKPFTSEGSVPDASLHLPVVADCALTHRTTSLFISNYESTVPLTNQEVHGAPAFFWCTSK